MISIHTLLPKTLMRKFIPALLRFQDYEHPGKFCLKSGFTPLEKGAPMLRRCALASSEGVRMTLRSPSDRRTSGHRGGIHRFFEDDSIKPPSIIVRKLCSRTGFTLIELLYVIIITTILSVIVIPLYLSIIKAAKTVEAQQALTEVQRLEELYLVDNNRYSTNLSQIGFRSQLKYYSVTIALKPDGFVATATGNLDGDMDTWTIDETGKLVHIIQD